MVQQSHAIRHSKLAQGRRMSLSRRSFCGWIAGSGLLAGADPLFTHRGRTTSPPIAPTASALAEEPTGSHLGSLYPFIQRLLRPLRDRYGSDMATLAH